MATNERSNALPPVVDDAQWRADLAALRVREKALTRELDALHAQRRALPMVAVSNDYVFEGADGSRSLLDLFDDRSQLIVYHFMFGTDWEAGCEGCSWVVDAMSHPAHLHARDVSIVLASRAPLEKLLAYRDRMGWDMPWYSAAPHPGGPDFNNDMGATIDGDENHAVSVFIRDGDQIYRSYFTEDRGVEHLGSHWTYLDLVPYGRQEEWEISPAGFPQSAAYAAQRRHDEY